ncbi:hypothetical protein RRG08_003086 [Elysia crispata]|uniref:Uncharacterized protein n=1 Tax=Elysia crispata TaxID=231223 RepID=A0AAE1B7K9_9GAST|nr:hypothetical protein RRG08_003086 [Elysia crispata]
MLYGTSIECPWSLKKASEKRRAGRNVFWIFIGSAGSVGIRKALIVDSKVWTDWPLEINDTPSQTLPKVFLSHGYHIALEGDLSLTLSAQTLPYHDGHLLTGHADLGPPAPQVEELCCSSPLPVPSGHHGVARSFGVFISRRFTPLEVGKPKRWLSRKESHRQSQMSSILCASITRLAGGASIIRVHPPQWLTCGLQWGKDCCTISSLPGFTKRVRNHKSDEHQNHVCCLGPHGHQASRGGPEPQRATSTRTMSVVLALMTTRLHEVDQNPRGRRAPEPCFTRWTRTPEGDEHQNHVCCLGPHDHQASRGGPEPQRATSTRTMSVVLALMTTRLHEVDQNPRRQRAPEPCRLSWPSWPPGFTSGTLKTTLTETSWINVGVSEEGNFQMVHIPESEKDQGQKETRD